MKNFIAELHWRTMLHDLTPGVEDHLLSGRRKGYIGFDPTGPSLTIGNYVQVMLLTFFQRAGHIPIALMGGATGRIGDPSGKDKERDLLSFDILEENVEKQTRQLKRFLNFEDGDNKALFINNLDFYKDMPVLDFLRDVGKNLTINYMMSKESVKKRLETGISFTEFSYQLLQGHDYYELYKRHGCTIQMGGSDQWGNITTGTEIIRRNESEAEVFAVTTPLLTRADGQKFGKSEEGNIWLDPEMTSPYQFYQFWINADDRDLPKLFRYFSLKSQQEVESLESDYREDPRALKRLLAEEVTARVHSEEDVENVVNVSSILFNPSAQKEQVQSLTKKEFDMIMQEIPSYEIPAGKLDLEVSLIDLLAEHTNICQSKGEARRAITSYAISVNREKRQDLEATASKQDFIHGEYLLLEKGKKNKFLVKLMEG